jgi:hypothetical protein
VKGCQGSGLYGCLVEVRVLVFWYENSGGQRRRIMEEPILYGPTQEPLDDEERELMDSNNWDWDNPVEVVLGEDFRVQLPIELTYEELTLLSRTARSRAHFA